MGSGWPEDGAIVLADLDLEYALMASREWHDAPTGPTIVASEVEKKVMALKTAAQGLQAAVKAGDESAYRGAIGKIGASCKSCHDDFKKD